MHRTSSDSDYLNDGKIVIDADGIPVDLGYRGTGSPEGEVSAPVGTVYTDTEATNGAIRWIKTSGTGNTGWRVEYGDTGWRDITDRSDVAESGTIFLRRSGNTVSLVFTDVQLSTRTGWQNLVYTPNGFRTGIRIDHRPVVATGVTARIMNYPVGQYRASGHESSPDPLIFRDMWETDETWPSSLPGTPA